MAVNVIKIVSVNSSNDDVYITYRLGYQNNTEVTTYLKVYPNTSATELLQQPLVPSDPPEPIKVQFGTSLVFTASNGTFNPGPLGQVLSVTSTSSPTAPYHTYTYTFSYATAPAPVPGTYYTPSPSYAPAPVPGTYYTPSPSYAPTPVPATYYTPSPSYVPAGRSPNTPAPSSSGNTPPAYEYAPSTDYIPVDGYSPSPQPAKPEKPKSKTVMYAVIGAAAALVLLVVLLIVFLPKKKGKVPRPLSFKKSNK